MADTVIELLPPCARIVLWAPPEQASGLSEAFGVALPPPMLTAALAGVRAALRLGPDEYLLLAEDGAAAALCVALATNGVSVTDVSHGQRSLRISGPGAADLLNEGCPLDLDAAVFPPGACTRTVFAKAAIILWRLAPDCFRIEIARSFAPYLRALLDEAAADLV